MIDVRVKFFGPLRDIAGDQITLSVAEPASGQAAFDALVTRYPQLQQWRSSVRLAVNLAYSGFDATLQNGDEIALIPPVSGG